MKTYQYGVINPIDDNLEPTSVLLLGLNESADKAIDAARKADHILFPDASYDVCKALYRPRGFHIEDVGHGIKISVDDHISSLHALNAWQQQDLETRDSSLIPGWHEIMN